MIHEKRMIIRDRHTGQIIELPDEIVHPTPIQYPTEIYPPPVHWPQPQYPPPMMQPTYPPPHPQYTAHGREKGAQLAGVVVFGYLAFWLAALLSPIITIFGWSALSGFLLYRAVKSFT